MTTIEKAVEILTEQGYQTIEWFEPNMKGDFCIEPCVRFEGNEFDLIKMYEFFEIMKYPISEAKRVYNKNPIFNTDDKEIGKNWTDPFNELTFAI